MLMFLMRRDNLLALIYSWTFLTFDLTVPKSTTGARCMYNKSLFGWNGHDKNGNTLGTTERKNPVKCPYTQGFV